MYIYNLRNAVVVVWVMTGIAVRAAHKAMRRWREPRAIATTLAFFVAQLMKRIPYVSHLICVDEIRLGFARRYTVSESDSQ